MDVSNEQLLDGKVVYGITPNGAVLEINASKKSMGWNIGLQGGGPTPLPLRGEFSRMATAKEAIRNYLTKLDVEEAIKAEKKVAPKKRAPRTTEGRAGSKIVKKKD